MPCFCVLIIPFGAHVRKLAALQCSLALGECFPDPIQRGNVEQGHRQTDLKIVFFFTLKASQQRFITLSELSTDF